MGWSPSQFGTLKKAVVEETFTSSDRVLCSRTQTIAGTQEVQVSDEKSVTVNINGSTKKSDHGSCVEELLSSGVLKCSPHNQLLETQGKMFPCHTTFLSLVEGRHRKSAYTVYNFC